MRSAKTIIYRYLSNADYFNIYKPAGTEPGGGGQTYTDFLTRFIPIVDWRAFFAGIPGVGETTGARGPRWTLPVNSIGVPENRRTQQLVIYQRRAASVCISSQRLHGRGANRVEAWRPEHGSPEPTDPESHQQLPVGLAIYLIRAHEREIWAGWFQQPIIYRDALAGDLLRAMLVDTNPGSVGLLRFRDGQLNFDETDATQPFFTAASAPPAAAIAGPVATVQQHRSRTEDELVSVLFQEDETVPRNETESRREYVVFIRRRNAAAVSALKELYNHECQVTGTRFTFLKRDGKNYTEAHHLIPLGEGGADDPRNIIIVSPLIHRMLHHASVGPIDPSRIEVQGDGSATLAITINNESYTIRWHPEHARAVLNAR